MTDVIRPRTSVKCSQLHMHACTSAHTRREWRTGVGKTREQKLEQTSIGKNAGAGMRQAKEKEEKRADFTNIQKQLLSEPYFRLSIAIQHQIRIVKMETHILCFSQYNKSNVSSARYRHNSSNHLISVLFSIDVKRKTVNGVESVDAGVMICVSKDTPS